MDISALIADRTGWLPIAADAPSALWAVILVGVSLTIWLEKRYRWASWLGGPTLGLLIAALLSNVGIMPPSAPGYDFADDFVLPVALALLLFRVDLVEISREARGMLVSFGLCVIGTIMGAVLAAMILPEIHGRAQVCGILTASYIGGAVNFAAVRTALGLDKTMTDALYVADNLVMVAIFTLLFSAASNPLMRRWYRSTSTLSSPDERVDSGPAIVASTDLAAEPGPFNRNVQVEGLAAALALAVAVSAIASALSPPVKNWVLRHTPDALQILSVHQILGNRFVLLAMLAVGGATLFQSGVRRLEGAAELGVYLLYIYLFVLGFPAEIRSMVAHGPILLLYCATISLSNLFVALAAGRVLRIRLEPLLLAINATVGGPSTAAAMAGSCGWTKLVAPALMIGLLGYAVANPIGILVGRGLIAVLGDPAR